MPYLVTLLSNSSGHKGLATLNWSGARTGSTLRLTMLCLIMIYITHQLNNSVRYTVIMICTNDIGYMI